MKPTRGQYFFAGSRLLKVPLQVLFFLLFVGTPVYFAYVVGRLLAHVYQPLFDIWNLVRLAFFVIVALLFVFLLLLVAGSCLAGVFWPMVRSFFEARDLENGAPFRVGDRVRILAGRHKDRVVRVYSDWRYDSVRVELGEMEKEKFTDIFSSLQLAREDVEPDAAPSSRPPAQLPTSRAVQASDSQRTASSGGPG